MGILGLAIFAVLGLFLLAGWLQGSIVCAVILWAPTAYLAAGVFGGPQPQQYHAAWIALAVSVLVFAAPRILVEIGRAEARKRAAGPTITLASPSGLPRP